MIANASTTVAAEKSITEVLGILAKMGAASISIRYDDSVPSGVGFDLKGPHGTRSFELPVQIDGVRRAMANEGAPRAKLTHEHATRVAWRISKDWLRAQGALIEAQMAQVDEIMLPWLVVERARDETPVTLYNRYLAQQGSLAIESTRADR